MKCYKRNGLILIAIWLLVFNMAACGDAAEPKGTEARTVTDQSGRAVLIDGAVEKIVSGYYISTSACIALGLSDRMAGIEARADERPIYTLAAPKLLELPNVGTAKEFNIEACVALDPDLVILPMRLQESADTLTDMGFPAIVVNPESYEELTDMLKLIGEAAGVSEKAAALINYYETERSEIAGATASLSSKPLVYMAGVGSYLATAPKGMYQSSLIALAGGINAAGTIEGGAWADISYEQLLAIDPEIMILPSEASYDVQTVLSDPLLSEVAAVRSGDVYQMPGAFEAWDSPVPSCMLGVRWMLSVVHPEQYDLETLRADAGAFYSEFYGIDIDTDRIGQ